MCLMLWREGKGEFADLYDDPMEDELDGKKSFEITLELKNACQ